MHLKSEMKWGVVFGGRGLLRKGLLTTVSKYLHHPAYLSWNLLRVHLKKIHTEICKEMSCIRLEKNSIFYTYQGKTETPIVSVASELLRCPTRIKTKRRENRKSDKWWVNHFTSVQTFPSVNESFWLAKYFHPFKLRSNFPNTTDLKIWASSNGNFD